MSVAYFAEGQVRAGSARGFYILAPAGPKRDVPVAGPFPTAREAEAARRELRRSGRYY